MSLVIFCLVECHGKRHVQAGEGRGSSAKSTRWIAFRTGSYISARVKDSAVNHFPLQANAVTPGQGWLPGDGIEGQSPMHHRIKPHTLLPPSGLLVSLWRCGKHTRHSYGDIPLFVPFFDIPVSFDNLFQRIASIYNRF